MSEPKIELDDGDYEIGEFADLMFAKWVKDENLKISNEKARAIFNMGFATCRKFFEVAVLPQIDPNK